jgi:hypothetical protein
MKGTRVTESKYGPALWGPLDFHGDRSDFEEVYLPKVHYKLGGFSGVRGRK